MIKDEQMKNILRWLTAVVIVGGLAEYLNKNVSPQAGYGLVYIVLLAYAITGNNFNEVAKGLKALGLDIGE